MALTKNALMKKGRSLHCTYRHNLELFSAAFTVKTHGLADSVKGS